MYLDPETYFLVHDKVHAFNLYLDWLEKNWECENPGAVVPAIAEMNRLRKDMCKTCPELAPAVSLEPIPQTVVEQLAEQLADFFKMEENLDELIQIDGKLEELFQDNGQLDELSEIAEQLITMFQIDGRLAKLLIEQLGEQLEIDEHLANQLVKNLVELLQINEQLPEQLAALLQIE